MKLFCQLSQLRGAARTLTAFCLLGTVSLSLAGCGQVNGSSQTSYAQLRVIDTSPSAGGLDIYVGTSPLTYNIGFGSVVAYTPILPGTYTLAADTAGSKTAVTSVRGSLAAGSQYSMLIGNTATGFESLLLTDQSQSAPGSQSILRIIDQASAIGSVDVYLVPTSGTLLTTKAVATSLAFNGIVTSISVPTNTYEIVLVTAGTTLTSTTTALYTSASVTFPAGSARTIVLLDTQVTTTPAVNAVVLSDYDSPYAAS